MKKLQLFIFLLTLPLLITTKASAQCATSSAPTASCGSGDMINSFTLNSIPSTGSGNACVSGSYTLFTSPVWTMTIGQSYNFSATVGSNQYPQGFAIWIDYNNNNQYDASPNEMLYTSATWGFSHSGSITIPATATAANVRMRIRCIYYTAIINSQSCGNTSYGEIEDYNVILAAACPAPSISGHPQNRVSCEAGSTSFSVTASNAVSYQWQVNTGSAWANVSGAVYGGATTNILSLSNIPLSYNNYQYRCVVTGGCNNPVNSNAGTLSVNPGASIASQTLSDTICRGGFTGMGVTVNGTVSGYQWQMAVATVGVFFNVPNSPPFSGVNTANLGIGNVPDSLNGYIFRCVVVGGLCPNIVSANIPITVLIAPEVVDQPDNDTIYPYNNATFDIAGTAGANLVYYWQASADGVNYSNINNNSLYQNVTTPILTVKAATPAMADWKFRCIIKATDPACGVFHDTSEAAQLIMIFPNDVSTVNESKQFDIKVYPNPVAGGLLYVQAEGPVSGMFHARVLDKLGRTVLTKDVELLQGKEVTIPVTQLAPGIYSLQLTDKEGNISNTTKFTRQ